MNHSAIISSRWWTALGLGLMASSAFVLYLYLGRQNNDTGTGAPAPYHGMNDGSAIHYQQLLSTNLVVAELWNEVPLRVLNPDQVQPLILSRLLRHQSQDDSDSTFTVNFASDSCALTAPWLPNNILHVTELETFSAMSASEIQARVAAALKEQPGWWSTIDRDLKNRIHQLSIPSAPVAPPSSAASLPPAATILCALFCFCGVSLVHRQQRFRHQLALLSNEQDDGEKKEPSFPAAKARTASKRKRRTATEPKPKTDISPRQASEPSVTRSTSDEPDESTSMEQNPAYDLATGVHRTARRFISDLKRHLPNENLGDLTRLLEKKHFKDRGQYLEWLSRVDQNIQWSLGVSPEEAIAESASLRAAMRILSELNTDFDVTIAKYQRCLMRDVVRPYRKATRQRRRSTQR